ncbi:MAG TPA: UDP-2,3-diacylglucosamine diphosphatase [Pseudomonadales bacterium]|nr:UDP-2,3-diacylglucosamine diphosphatase [Pseudomonadales bacterium]
MTRTLFISDLHLDPAAPAGIALFERFCTEVASGADSLYVLGDLFEMWIGDDGDDAAARAVIDGLGRLAAAGTRCHLMHGNRDFLIGETLAAACGATLVSDPTTIRLGTRRCVLSHGDALCTADAEYMAVREGFRSPAFAADMLARPLAERAAFAAEARRRSRESNANKPERIMDVTHAEVDALLDAADADLLVHGHTHRPDIHRWQQAGRERTRIVLGAWGGSAVYGCADGDEVALHTWP